MPEASTGETKSQKRRRECWEPGRTGDACRTPVNVRRCIRHRRTWRGCSLTGMGDVQQFIDSMTGHLAWPVVSMVSLAMFRKSIVAAIGRIKQAKIGTNGVEVAL